MKIEVNEKSIKDYLDSLSNERVEEIYNEFGKGKKIQKLL